MSVPASVACDQQHIGCSGCCLTPAIMGQMSEFLRGKLEDLLVASDATNSPGCREADVSRC
jgi:hypothetical protein